MEATAATLVSGTPEYRKLSIALVLAGLATFSVLYSVQALLPALATSFHVSAEGSSLVVSMATGAMALTLLVASVISDRIGRQQLMTSSLFAAAVLTVLSAVLPGWHTLLITRFLTGIALAGIPAIAMAYVAEEVHPSSIGGAMGLYIAGAAIGGMAGRLGASVICDLFGWRVALASVGLSGLIGAAVFSWAAPPSRSFVARKHDWRSFLETVKSLRGDAALPWLYAEAFLLMGAFVTIYNYAGFHLLAAPYSLSQTTAGAIFLFYIVGSFSSTWFGHLAGRLGRRLVFWIPILILLGGVALTTARPLICIILGIGVVTFGYFGAHSIASSWVSRRGGVNSAQAAAFYLCSLYLGSSIVGTAGGIAWSRAGWIGVAAFTGVLVVLALAIAIRLVAVKPLPQNVVVTEKVDTLRSI
jgi:MFS transporter, YNFM family, putative membrane transport protein